MQLFLFQSQRKKADSRHYTTSEMSGVKRGMVVGGTHSCNTTADLPPRLHTHQWPLQNLPAGTKKSV